MIRVKFVFKLLFILLIVLLPVVLFLGYEKAKEKLISFLSNPIEIGNVLIIPQDFQSTSILKLKWKSIKVVFDSTSLFIEKPKIFIHPMVGSNRELLNISIDSIYASINNQQTTNVQSKTNKEHISHPDIWLPFRVLVRVNKIATDIKDIGSWKLDSLVAIKSARQKRFFLKANNINGTYIAKNLFLNADYRWGEIFSDASISISDRKNDSLAITLNAPRKMLEDLSAEINAYIADLPFWLKDKLPQEAPAIGIIVLNSNASINVLHNKADFNLSLQTHIGEFWQLPAFNAAITAFGNISGISQSEISLKGKNGESIKIKGNINKDLDGSAELEIEGINLTLGPETLPTDAKFHRITKKGNSITANFTTNAGSNFITKIDDLNEPVIVFSADIVPKEPWAVQWTGEMVKLESPTILTGSFAFKNVLLKANLKTKVPYAYYAAADELDVNLWLNSDGIHFPQGTIKRGGYKSEFTGEVMWSKEFFTFKLNQSNGGNAEIHGTFEPKIELSLQNLNSHELPYADPDMLKGYSGFISGNLKQDFGNRKGKASVSLSTEIKNYKINAKSDIEMLGDSLIVKNFELEQNEKRIEGYLSALIPNEARKNLEIQQAGIKVPSMDIVSLLAIFKDSTLLSGIAKGNLEYDKNIGLAGKFDLSKIILRGLDPSTVSFPNLKLEASGYSAKISAPIFLTGGLWNGDLELNVNNIGQKSDLPIFVSYAANNIDNAGSLKFEGIVNKDMEKISGNIQVLGDWFLPNGVGEVKNTNISISAKSSLGKNILDSLTANFSTKKNSYEMGILKIPFTFDGHIKKGIVSVDSAFIYGEQDEKIIAKLQFDLNSANLKEFSFYTDQFTLFLLNEHQIKIKNGTGKTKIDPAGVTVFAELPSISYRMESPEYGTASATLKGNAAYHFPFQIEQTQTNSSITGNFEISKASYRKNMDLMPDPMHLDKTLKVINKFRESLVKEKRVNTTEMHAMTSRPTTLNIKLQTSGMDAATISSNLAAFAFVVNVSVLGTTRNILLSGDINAVGKGQIGYKGLTMFDLSRLRLYWLNTPIKQGIIDLQASNNYPFCMPEEGSNEKNCTINMNVTGPFAKLNMQPTANCDIEASTALIYYSMLLGCISEDYTSGTPIDRNKLAGKFLGKFMSSTINKSLGGNVVGNIDFKWQIFGEKNSTEQDTNYIRVPISLSRWVSNLEAILGWSSDESSNRSYDQSYEAGLRYSLPVFDSTDISRNFIDPSLDLNANLVARRYIAGENAYDETRLEKNVGLLYVHKFWDPCILGIGYCKVADNLMNSPK
ncbi:MAG: hypothetical protein LBC75_01540 [Fibromonadaceae bacterium]|nr:hypothetical protein [Fibromonadaceae bacterium]